MHFCNWSFWTSNHLYDHMLSFVLWAQISKANRRIYNTLTSLILAMQMPYSLFAIPMSMHDLSQLYCVFTVPVYGTVSKTSMIHSALLLLRSYQFFANITSLKPLKGLLKVFWHFLSQTLSSLRLKAILKILFSDDIWCDASFQAYHEYSKVTNYTNVS